MFNDPKWNTIVSKCRDEQIEVMQKQIIALEKRIEELEKKENGYQYDSKGNRVTVKGHLTKRGEHYTHHDTCGCGDGRPLQL